MLFIIAAVSIPRHKKKTAKKTYKHDMGKVEILGRKQYDMTSVGHCTGTGLLD
jgi:hypothetical protein